RQLMTIPIARQRIRSTHRCRFAYASSERQYQFEARHDHAHAAVIFWDGHPENAHLEQELDDPLGYVLLLIDEHGRMLMAEVGFQLRHQPIAAFALLL